MDQVTAKLNDKQEYCAQLEANLKDYKEQHLYLEQKTEELEGQLKKLEADVLDAKASKEQALQELQQQRQQSTELDLRIAELSKQLEAEREAMSSAKSDLQKKSEALEQAKTQNFKARGGKMPASKKNLEKSKSRYKVKQLKDFRL